MDNRTLKLEEGKFYHIFNRGNNRENLFHKHENYIYFLRKFDLYLTDFVETYAYCLLPNHFHMLIRVKQFNKPNDQVQNEKMLSEAFRRFFNSYSKSINKQQGRVGSLFQKNFKRKLVENQAYFTSLIFYIHSNPAKHGIMNDFKDYPYSSYGRILIEKPTKLLKTEVLEWFGGKDLYQSFHEKTHINDTGKGFILEDED